ncbi:ATP-grasp domain-containing protein [Kitasatospora sp. McL0602]|uniref:ATP-grasp domain-containing protein n=1 Tax=Kitasatospora sp. McL0602 TaxID=3439530 RepID=UPI003F88D17D
MTERPVIAVVYDQGSVTPMEILENLEPLGDVVLAVCRSEHTEQIGEFLEELTEVVHVGDDLDAAAAQLARHRPDAVITFSEVVLHTTAELAVRLGLPFHRPETVRLLRDKYAQRSRLRERGVDTVRSALLREPADWAAALAEVGLPAVLKPSDGAGSRSTYLIEEAAQGAALVAELLGGGEGAEEGSMVLEEYLLGRDCGPFGDHISIESAVVDGEITHWAVTGKYPLAPPFRELGQFWPASLPEAEQDAALELTTQVLRALDVRTGITHTELKLTADGPRLIEINGRLGGYQTWLARLTGTLNPVRLAARIGLGGPVEVETAPDGEVYFVRFAQSPREGGTLTAVHGIGDILTLPGIETAAPMVPLGEVIPASVGTGVMVAVSGVSPDHRAMMDLLDDALGVLSFDLAGPNGTRRLTPAQTEAA